MNYGKLFTCVVAAMTICVEISAQDTPNVDSLQQVIETQRQAMEDHQARLDALEQAETAKAETASFDKIWKQKKHLTIGFGPQTLTNLDGNDLVAYQRKSTAAFSLEMGKTIYMHKKPLANMVKIGIDWNYIDFHFAQYKKTENTAIKNSNDDDDDFDYDDDDDFNYGDILGIGDSFNDFKNLGCYHLNMGMAFGPSVQVTPLYNIGKGLEHIKAYTYFHVIPSGSVLFFSENDETKIGYSYVTNFSWGIGISWRFIAIGFETRWGNGKHNMSAFDEDGMDIENVESLKDFGSLFKSDKVKYKTTKSMVTISLRW